MYLEKNWKDKQYFLYNDVLISQKVGYLGDLKHTFGLGKNIYISEALIE